MVCDSYPILSREEIGQEIWDYRVHCPQLASKAEPGQFVHIGVPGFSLRRPISICGIDREEGNLRLVFAVRGQGTRMLATLQPGQEMDILGPLGHGFSLLGEESRIAVVGGGIGVPPLLELAGRHQKNCTAILGFRSREQVILDVDFAALCDTVVCTDDGSYGVEGTVAPALESLLQACRLDMVYACGPKPMLRATAELCRAYGVRCQLSLEERMACGVGACLGCAVKILRDGKETYLHVCKDGPVFEAGEVIWE